jgi:hypothetical protein
MAGRFQSQPIEGNKLVDDDGHPTPIYRKWLDKIPAAVTSPGNSGTVPTADNHFQGIPGQLAYDENFLYVCIDTNQWKRLPLTDL